MEGTAPSGPNSVATALDSDCVPLTAAAIRSAMSLDVFSQWAFTRPSLVASKVWRTPFSFGMVPSSQDVSAAFVDADIRSPSGR